MTKNVTLLNDSSLEEAITTAGKPTLLKLGAAWCGPCKMIAPILEEIAGEYNEKVQIVEVDVDESPKTTAAFSVRAVPTLVLIDKSGIVVQKVAGMQSKSKIVELIQPYLS